jgi:hypothetical protein
LLRRMEYPPPLHQPGPYAQQQHLHHPIESQQRPSTTSAVPSSSRPWDFNDSSQFAYNLPPLEQTQQHHYRPSSAHSYDPYSTSSSSWGSYDSTPFEGFRYRPDSSHGSSRPSSSSSSQFAFSLDGSADSRPSTSAGADTGSRPVTRSGEQVDNAFGSLTLQQDGTTQEGINFFAG